ncbi:MAG: EboA domain-containing protein [Bradymonadia bacterium]
MKSDSIRRALLDLIRLRSGDTEGQWLEHCLVDASRDLDGVLTELSKRFSKRHLIAGFSERSSAVLMTQLGPMPIGHWRTDRAARSWLLATLSASTSAPFKQLFSYYESGDTETRIATLLAINLVDDTDSAQGMMLIHDAGRTYLDELMDAAWCNHPFSTHHMSDVEYRKAVLKALFCDVEISGFLRLDERADAELAASLRDFADEREAAGRPVPDVLWPVLAMHPQPGVVARLVGRLEHPLSAQRLVAATSLRNARDARALSFLEERLSREDSPEVQAMIRAAIQASTNA